jgi:hypothetical protein
LARYKETSISPLLVSYPMKGISSTVHQHLYLTLLYFMCLRVAHNSLEFIYLYKAGYLLGSWLGSPCKWWWMHCFGLLWPQGQEEDRDAVLDQMTSILGRRRVAMVPDEPGIRLSLQTGSRRILCYNHHIWKLSGKWILMCSLGRVTVYLLHLSTGPYLVPGESSPYLPTLLLEDPV